MPDLSRDDVTHLASLARIDLSDEELDRMVGELASIISSVEAVSRGDALLTVGARPSPAPRSRASSR